MPIIGSNWFRTNSFVTAQGANTITHAMGFTPDFWAVQYLSGAGNPSLQLIGEVDANGLALHDRTFWAFCQSNAAGLTVHAWIARLHTTIS